MSTALAPIETARLHDLESTIAHGLKTFVEVGSALARIREERLYRDGHATFEDYCREKWGMGRANAYELMAAAEVVGNLSGTPDIPTSVSQARPLTKLEPEKQREVWQEAVETAPEGKVTAAHVAATVERLTQPTPARSLDDFRAQRDAQAPAAPNIVKDTVTAAKAEYRTSDDGRLDTYIQSLPPIPTGISAEAFDRLHVSGREILRLHADFIARLNQKEKVHATA